MSRPPLPMPQSGEVAAAVGQRAAGGPQSVAQETSKGIVQDGSLPQPLTEHPGSSSRRERSAAEAELDARYPRALVVEPCKAHANALGSALQRAGFAVSHAASAEEVTDPELRRAGFQLVLSELKLPGQSGLGLLRRVRQACPETAFFVLTGQPDVASSVSALALGATEYLTKPLDEARLVVLCRAAVARTSRDARSDGLLTDAVPAPPPRDECADLEAQSAAMRGLLLRLPGLSQSAAPVLLHGEPGVGKRLVAQVVHRLSACASGPLVVVRPEELGPDRLPVALWGQSAAGAAEPEERGAVLQASGGSLIITAVERLSAPDRWLLARLITRGLYRPVGSSQERAVAVRVLLTTTQPVALLTGEPDEDLLPGLRCVELRVPPLRERAEDVLALAARLLGELAEPRGALPLTLAAESARLLLAYRWPGNGSELRAALAAAVQQATGHELGPELLPAALTGSAVPGRPVTLPAVLSSGLVRPGHFAEHLDADTCESTRHASYLSTGNPRSNQVVLAACDESAARPLSRWPPAPAPWPAPSLNASERGNSDDLGHSLPTPPSETKVVPARLDTLPNPAGRPGRRALRQALSRGPRTYRGRRNPGPSWLLARLHAERRRQQQAEAKGDGC